MVSNEECTIYLHKFILESAISKEGAHFSDIHSAMFQISWQEPPLSNIMQQTEHFQLC